MDDFVRSLSDPASLLSMAVAVAMFMTVVGVMLPALKGDKLETRLKQVSAQRDKLRRASRADLEQTGLKREAKGTISDITKKLDLQKMLEDPNIEAKMEQAGMRGPRPLTIFYFCRFALPFVFGLLVFLFIFFVNDFGLAGNMKFASIIFGLAIGFYAPNLYVGNVAAKRQQSIMKAFRDALDMMLICLNRACRSKWPLPKLAPKSAQPQSNWPKNYSSPQLNCLTYKNVARRTRISPVGRGMKGSRR